MCCYSSSFLILLLPRGGGEMKGSRHQKRDEQLCESRGQAYSEARAAARSGPVSRAQPVPKPSVGTTGQDNHWQEAQVALLLEWQTWGGRAAVPGYLTVFTSPASGALETMCALTRASQFRRLEGHLAVTSTPGPCWPHVDYGRVLLGPYTLT